MTPRSDLQIVEQLVALTHKSNISIAGLARILDVNPVTVKTWISGTHWPYYPLALAWATHHDRHVAVVDHDGEVLAQGAEVPFQFRKLRERAGLTQKQVAARVGTSRNNISIREHHRQAWCPYLATVANHVAALDYRLTLLEVTR